MKTLLSTATIILLLSTMNAQSVQWASRVVAMSSQYSDKQYSAEQALGAPNVLPVFRESPCAWSPFKVGSRQEEFLHLEYKTPMRCRQVAVAESQAPGAVTRIYLYDTKGKEHLVYENTVNTPLQIEGRMLMVPFPLTDYEVRQVKLVLNTSRMKKWNHIDAVGISDSEVPIEAKINLVQGWDTLATIENLGPMVNTEFDEIMPIISTDGKTLYFDRKDHPKNTSGTVNDDIWTSIQDGDGNWSLATNLGQPLNNSGHNFLCAVSGDCKTVLLGNQYLPDGSTKGGLSKSQLVNGKWETPTNVVVTNYYNNNKFTEFSISPNCKILMMTVQRTDGVGGKDIYVSFEQGDKYSEPLNIGPTVNSAATEMSPFLAADGKTLFFASDGHSGFGNKDIFITRRLDDTWTNWTVPQNLGPNVNSSDWDAYFTVPASGDYGYLSSESKSFGKTDIYRIRLPKSLRPSPTLLLKGRIQDKETGTPIVGRVSCKAKGTSKDPETVDYDPANGDVSLVLSAGYVWEISIESIGFVTKAESIDLSLSQSFNAENITWQLQRK